MEKISQVLRVHKINRAGVFANYVANFSVIFFFSSIRYFSYISFPFRCHEGEKRGVKRIYSNPY